MPGKVKVKIIAGRNLPVMDRSSDTTDAYVEIKLGNTTYKTDVCRKSLNPQWNSEWYRFEVDDSELQDEPLQIRLMDHDTYSANDAIGKVYLNLNPLLIPTGALPSKYGWGGETNVDQPSSSVMSGWIPVYDTMHGIRGEVNVTVKVELFSDFNKFRQSSCGVQFFCSPVIPHGFHAQVIHGFIEELVVNDDPEYQWIDKIRTPRASNEARQTLFFKLSGELQRKIGVKALDLGGNAVIGYNQCFDLEGESGIVARGIGTVVTLVKHHEMQQQLDIGIAEEKALSYLKFLAFDNGLKLDNDNIFERFMLSSSPVPNSVFVSTPDNLRDQFTRFAPKRSLLRQTSQPLIEFEPLPRTLKTCISSRSLSDDLKEEIAWKQLLRQEEMRASGAGLSNKIKLLKQNMIYKKMNAFRNKLPEESLNLDTASITSKEDPCAIRTSLIDLRELRKKKKQISSSSCMAELLVRSVMHAHTSLDCIAECHDTVPSHSTSTSVLVEDTGEDASHKKCESENAVVEITPTILMNKTISEPYLLLPDNTIVDATLNSSSDSELSSSEGSDSPTEIKDKLDFDTVSLIVKNVKDQEIKQRRLSEIRNIAMESPETTKDTNDCNLLELPVHVNNKVEQIIQSMLLDKSLEHKKRGKLTKMMSKSYGDITEIKSTEANNNTENVSLVNLPVDIEKRIEKLRHSALFRSISERPRSILNKTFSISHEDISTSIVDFELNVKENEVNTFDRKRRMSKALSISCEEIYSPNVVEIEKRSDKLRDCALFKSIKENLKPRRRGKLQKMFSISCDDNIEKEQDNPMVLPVDIEKKIENLLHSPLFGGLNPESQKKGKMTRALSKSCTDISLCSKIEIDNNKKSLNTTIQKKIDLFKNSPLFKISVITQQRPRGKMNRELSKSHSDITNIIKNDFTAKNNSRSNPDLHNIPLVKTAMHAILSEKINLLTPGPAPMSPKASELLLYSPNDPDLENSFLKNAVQTMLMEKVDLMTSQHAPVSNRIKEEFQKNTANSVSRSDPDISSHFIKSAINKFSFISKKSPTFTRKSRGSCIGSFTPFNSDSNILEENSVTSLILDKIHHLRRKSQYISHRSEESTAKLDSRTQSEVDGHGLVKTAMETMLMEKVNILTPPVSPEKKIFEFDLDNNHTVPHPSNFSEQCDNVCASHESETDMHTMSLDRVNIISTNTPPALSTIEGNTCNPSRHPHLDKIKCTVHTVLDKVHILSPKSTDKKFFSESEGSLTKTAMQAMLIDRVNLIAPDTATNTIGGEPSHNNNKHGHSKLDQIKTTVHSVCDKVTHLSSTSPINTNKFDFGKKETETTLMTSAMQTILIDKINTLAPEVSTVTEDSSISEMKPVTKYDYPKFDRIKEVVHTVYDKVAHLSPTSLKSENKFNFSEEESSLTKTAMQTMLIDKINIIAPDVTPIPVEDIDDTSSSSLHETKHEHNVKAALTDKVHHLSKKKENKFDQSLTKTAMQTMLLDKVNIIAPDSSPVFPEETNESIFSDKYKKPLIESPKTHNEVDNQSLMKSAMQTILMENVNIVAPHSESRPYSDTDRADSRNTIVSFKSEIEKKRSIFSSIKKKCKFLNPKISLPKFFHKSKQVPKEDGLMEAAMTTILLDRVNNIQGILNTTDEENNQTIERDIEIITEEMAQNNNEASEKLTLPIETFPKASKKRIDITLTSPSIEEPNINVKPDTGDNFNNKAVTTDVANCNTNAEHASCLQTSDRRIVESPVPSTERERERERENVRESRERHGHQRTESTGGKMSQSPARLNAIPCIHRRSSDSDLSITPKGNSLTGSDRSGGTIPGYHHIRSTLLRPTVDNFDMMEYPFLTMAKYPPGFILHLGGAVSARSVKLLERITNIEEPETRDTWWSEIRMEIRTHARALNCNAVLGYTESTSICDEVCVLSASGTAAVIALYSGELSDGISGLPNLHKPHIPNKDLMTTSLDRTDFERDKNTKNPDSSNNNSKISQVTESPEHEATIEFSGNTSAQTQPLSCRICHIPYSEFTMSFRINMLYCSLCKMAKVPDILLTTIEIPEGLPITGRGCFLQSYVCRPKRDLKGELNAKEISESLPFLEYELHRLLVNKMKVKAMNTIFGLKVRITIGERMLIGIATGTAVFLLPLPPPPLPKLIAGNSATEDKRLIEMQKLLVDTVRKNKEIYELKDVDTVQPSKLLSDTEESDDEKSNVDLGAGNKDSCVLEVDDSEDIEVINLLVEPRPPDGFHVVNTENVPGLEELEIVKNLQMFTQVWRAKIPLNQSASHFGKHFQKLLQSVYFKLRRMIPCALCDLQFRVDLPEPDEIQLTLLGMALGLGDPVKLSKYKRKNMCHLPSKEHNKKSVDDELIFSLEEDHIPENSIPVITQGTLLNPQVPKHRQKSPQRLRVSTKQRHTPVKERHGVDITPLSYVPGGKIERYLGYLNFFFIRETTSIREGGGLSGFVHSFITEVLAIVRAHVTALGGNAMVAYFMTECALYHNAHKNQGQCLINVGGDVVFVSYFTEDN